MAYQTIEITNVRQHNLKGFNLSIPLGKITVLTGPSGSGKSTLALDVLFAEGQYRYIESLGISAKYIGDLWSRPIVDEITGLPPPIVFEQKSFPSTPKSNVATITGISDFLRLFFATCGQPHCPECRMEIRPLSIDQMADIISSFPENTKLILMAPITKRMDLMPFDEILNHLKRDGFFRVRIDGTLTTLDTIARWDKRPKSLELIIDRLILKPGILSRLADSLALALREGNGLVKIEIVSAKKENEPEIFTFSEKMTCPICQRSFPALSPQVFSRSHPDGMCFSCKGKGKGESNQPCIICNGTGLSPFARSILIGGKNFPDLMAYSIHEIFLWLLSFSHENSKKNQAIRNIPAGVRIIEAILSRLKPLEEMGLGYLKLNRTSATLSGGEIQKLRLGAQLGRDLTGILYILDEPAAALYASEKQSLWQNLIHLKNQGNTIILVEHNLDFIRSADHVIELGPGAADQGGDLIFSGTAEDMTKSNQSITGQYLKGNRCLKRYQHKRKIYNKIILCNARKNNLKNITVKFPLDCLVCVTGVSGCGKSTLVTDELYHALKGKFQEGSSIKTELVLKDKLFTIPEVILVDQAPLTKVRYSMPATYMRVFTHIKTLFSRVPEARRRGYKASYFGLTSKGGRCERCRGQGFLDLELQYLPSIKTNCDLCGGMRYSRETLKIKYKGLNIAEILNMTVKDAIDFFIKIPNIRVPLEAIEKIGLGYLKLGQPAHTLSGGEAQRLKLARELSKQTHGPTIYIMDEPCRGLHQKDLENFISVLDEFLEQGHSIIIIESRSDILDLADWIIKLGPGGGPEGGNIIAEGPPLIIKKGLQDIQPVAPFKFSSVNSIKLS